MEPSGVQSWKSDVGKRNHAGMTPMTVYDVPVRMIGFPSTWGSPPNRDCQRP